VVSALSPTRTVPVDSVADVASWGRIAGFALPAVAKPVGGGGLFDLERKRSLIPIIAVVALWLPGEIFKKHF